MRVVTFCGSTGERSANRSLLDATAAALVASGHTVVDATMVAEIPVFRPELVDHAPPAVAGLRAAFESADVVLLAIPEYGGGAAGWAKNALDWMVGSGSLYRRVAAVLCAGTTGGANAIEQIARTLTWQGAFVVATLGVSAPRTKSDASGAITDASTLVAITDLVARIEGAAALDDAACADLAADTVRPLGIDPVDRTSRHGGT